MFFYSDTGKSDFSGAISRDRLDGTAGYLRHYDNYLFLQFVTNNPRSSEVEKRQARAEMEICERKMKWWQGLPRYDQAEAVRGVEQLKKRWQMEKVAA